MAGGHRILEQIAGGGWAHPTASEGLPGERVALISGVKRADDDFHKMVKLCLTLREERLVDRFVFSTWEDQQENFQELLQTLAPAKLVLSRAPNGVALQGSPVHQSCAWLEGLGVCQPNDIVLKFRTDRASDVIVTGLARRMNAEGLRQTDISGGYPRIFEKRPIVPYFNPVFPFLIHDIEFVMMAKDFATICNLDLANFLFLRMPTTEGFFYGKAFADKMSIIRRLQSLNMLALVNESSYQKWFEGAIMTMSWPWMHMLYLQIIKRYFDIGWDSAHHREALPSEISRQSFGEIMSVGLPEARVYKHAKYVGTVANSSLWLNYFDRLRVDTKFEERCHEIWKILEDKFYQEADLDIDFFAEAKTLGALFRGIIDAEGNPYNSKLIRTTKVIHSD